MRSKGLSWMEEPEEVSLRGLYMPVYGLPSPNKTGVPCMRGQGGNTIRSGSPLGDWDRKLAPVGPQLEEVQELGLMVDSSAVRKPASGCPVAWLVSWRGVDMLEEDG